MKLKYRVYFGYSNNDYISITDEQLEKAQYCMISGKVLNAGNKMIRGSEIKRIEEDYRYYTGWNDSYHPSSQEDTLQIKRDCPPELNERLNLAIERVQYAIQNKKENVLLQNPDKLLLQ
jgi:hypothetical protein